MGKRSTALFVLSGLFALVPMELSGQGIQPVQAQLVQRLDAAKALVGDSILAKVQSAWKNDSCELRAGAIIQGHVVSQKAHSKTEKTSELAILFDTGQCDGREMKPFSLTIAAVVAPPREYYDVVEGMQPLSSAVGVVLNGNTQGNASPRSLMQSAATVYWEPNRPQAPTKIMPGQVVGIPHLSIRVGQGEGGASILSASGRDVRLIPGTILALVPNLGAVHDAAGNTKTVTTETPKEASAREVTEVAEAPPEPIPPEIATETERCIAPECSVAPMDTPPDDDTRGAQMTLSLKDLGYLPTPPHREMSKFNYDPGIAYLGPNQLLFTFNPHTLVPRTPAEAESSRRLHLIRAAVIDLDKKQVSKTVDWKVPDYGKFLWPVGEDQVLVHVGQELRLYGPSLKLRRQISLGGPLAFLRVSPLSEYFAVGIIHERHTKDIHRQLETAELREPEEDVEVRLFDSQFNVLTTWTTSSRVAPPILMNEGDVQIFNISQNHWRVVENSWTKQRRVLALATSTCRPQAESLAGNLLFLVGCDHQPGDKWYRVLSGDGKVLLKGWSPSSQLEQTAGGNVGSNAFAIRVAEADRSRVVRSVFTPSELKSARVTVYSAKNGRRIFSIGLPEPVPAVQTFALSPGEDRLALLTAGEIAFYRLGATD
jgi:hypothetical protein